MPVVDRSTQNTSLFAGEMMAGLAKWKYPQAQMLFVLCGATGMRIGEALGLEIDKYISSDCRTFRIGQKARRCTIEDPLKTKNAVREVDPHSSVAELLREFVSDPESGFLFQSRNGKPLPSSNIVKRHLHPALKALGYTNPITGTARAGTHAFRRFHNTYSRTTRRAREDSTNTGWGTRQRT